MGYTVMVVDDSETIRDMLERMFGMTKLPIDTIVKAINGADALEKLESHWIDFIFTDIHMPVMDGIVLIDRLNDSPVYKDIPVIVISTEGSEVRLTELKRKGIKGYLRKPFTSEGIRDILIKVTGGTSD